MRDIVYLDGSELIDRAHLHATMSEKFSLPAYYGKNLDALWDCLSMDFSERLIIIRDPFLVERQLGRYGKAFLQLFRELQQRNRHVKVVFVYPFE